ncbi:substrate-binding domain-containing protein [Desulfomonile tiedjei]|uniref:PBP domain-containing protein n=1 Tax=Desulfomonile tiedjei (strain ATCC 49306 / DSM 6799 / DCB-1) TaxID=706587 RepID=I4C8H1_DESTA|nr:substrate-binding domain-containing protein [Desulfomonile tiedjei]AFM25862.1 hypothetical protein Desti_3201 [Desulfomonile tiedjei DSM 6799]
MKRWFAINEHYCLGLRRNLSGRIALYLIICLTILLGGFEATALNSRGTEESRLPDSRQLDRLTKLDSDSLIRMIRLAGRDRLMFVLKNIDADTLAGILRTMEPEKLAKIIRVLADEQFLAHQSQNRRFLNRENVQREAIQQTICEPDKKVEPATTPVNVQPPASETEPSIEIDRSVSLIIHPSNPIRELSTRQLKQLISGDVTNWSQLGGPDLPLKMVTTHPRHGIGEFMNPGNLIQAPFDSLVVVGVAGTRGALGLVRTQNERQRSFLNNHSAVKTLGIRTASEKP